MSHLPIDPNDPRLTAYVLGELTASETTEVERALEASPELRAAVEELRETAGDLFAALQAEPTPAVTVASAVVRAAVIARPGAAAGSKGSTSAAPASAAPTSVAPRAGAARRGWLMVNVVTLLLLVGVLVALQDAGPESSRSSGRDPRTIVDYAESKRELAEHMWSDWNSAAQSQMDAPEGFGLVAKQPEQESFWAWTKGAPVQDQQARKYNELMRQHRYVEAKRLAQEARQAAPQNPALETMYRESEVARESANPSNNAGVTLFDFDLDGAASPEARPEARFGTTPPVEAKHNVQAPFGRELDPAGDATDSYRLRTDPLHRQFRVQPAAPSTAPTPHPGPVVAEVVDPVGQYHNGVPVQLNRRLADGQGISTARLETLNQLSIANPEVNLRLLVTPRLLTTEEPFLGERLGIDQLAELERVDAESYAPIVENEFITPTGEAALSTFSLDVDTASYSNVRRFLVEGRLPPSNAVRLEELVNYFRYDLPQPQEGEPLSVTLEATSSPWNPRNRLVRIALQGREIDYSKRPLTRLVFLVDISGSMSDTNKLPLVKQSLRLLVEKLGENDRIAIVTYADAAGLKLDSTSGNEREKILQAIESLNAEGSTNGAGGIQLAYEIATQHFDPAAANRIILCTDGDFNVGVSSDDELVKLIERQRQTGVFLSIFGFGMGNLKDSKLEGLADKGNGHYAYIDDLDEARKVFIEELTGTLYTIAKDVKLQVEFNPARVAAYRLLGYENRLLQAEDFNNDRVDAGELGAGHSVTALYEIVPVAVPPVAAMDAQPAVDPLRYQAVEGGGVRSQESGVTKADGAPSETASSTENSQPSTLNPQRSTELLTVKLRYKQTTGDVSVKREFSLSGEPRACSQDLQFAAAVSGFGMLLRKSKYAAGCNWDLVIELAEGAKGDDPTGRRREFVVLARQAQRLAQEYQRLQLASGRLPEMTSVSAAVLGGQVQTDSPAVVQFDRAHGMVWINRGALDDVQPRMTFSVLDAPTRHEEPVPASGLAAANRKATLEVVEVIQQSARCRVVTWDQMRSIGIGDRIESDQWPPRVLEVAGSRFGVISLGAKQGVRNGAVYQVIRLGAAKSEQSPGPQLAGELRVIDVRPDDSVGQFTPAVQGNALMAGDRITPRQ